uniref:C2H2-type domain-containing protein n=1 Tax=Anabas testudineus TaxID=64144 RepID=A0AAQ6IR68_ANATE
ARSRLTVQLCSIYPPLLLPSLRLFIPPLRLVSAAMWQVLQRGNVQDYGLVEEFICTVTEIVPELLNADQKAQLLLGLRARVRLRRSFSRFGICVLGFMGCLFTLKIYINSHTRNVKCICCGCNLFQDVFPTDFGPEYDSALQMLMLDFLSRIEKLLPVPDIQQTAAMLSAVPSALEECVHSVPDPQHLRTVLLYHTTLGHFDLSGEFCLGCQMQGCMTVQVEGETVTLLDYIQIEQPSGLVEPDDHEENEVNMEETTVDAANEDTSDALKPAVFQPLKQSKRLQLKRKALKDKDSATAKRQRKKYSNNKTCPVCSKTFLRAAAMRRHLEIHSANRDLRYKCANCDKRFRDHYDMNRHNMRVHEKEDLSTNVKEEDLGDPSTSDTSENKNCALCGKYFARRVDMDRHMKSHSEDRPYKCSFCEKKFKNPYVLKRHQREICNSREQKKPKRKETQRSSPQPPPGGSTEGKVCPICSRILPCTADIAKHLRSHTEERPFICITCEKGFKYKDTLKKHQIIHGHEGIREEQSKTVEQILAELLKVCPVCSRAFDNIKTLNRHIQCHTDDRPYHCVHCKKRFKHMHGLKRHQIYAICHKKITRFSWKKELRAGPSQSEATSADPQQGFQTHDVHMISNVFVYNANSFFLLSWVFKINELECNLRSIHFKETFHNKHERQKNRPWFIS